MRKVKRTQYSMRIAVCGAGVSGLTLAGILSRRLERLLPNAHITVLERGAADRDQGYGLDLDEHGQIALIQAGVSRDTYWKISRPRSDSACIYHGSDESPGVIKFSPSILQRWFPSALGARPESNRGALRDALLEAIAPRNNVCVQFEEGVYGIRTVREQPDMVQLLNRVGEPIGEFDVVIDGMGVHSTLRHHRVHDKSGGKHSTGICLVHGVINDPETSWSKDTVERFATHGSLGVGARGHVILLQRFGAGQHDNRTAFFYMVHRKDGEAGLFRDVGIEASQSRAAGIMVDHRLQKVKNWILADMEGVFAPFWNEIVQSVDRITIREQVSHGESELLSDRKYPIICIGDSLWNCGLGGGGILAMQDALQLADMFTNSQNGFLDFRTGKVNMNNAKLATVEAEMLTRKANFNAHGPHQRLKLLERVPEKSGTKFDWSDFWPGDSMSARAGRTIARWTLGFVFKVLRNWYSWELKQGCAGSDHSSPVYPSVAKALEDEVAHSKTH